MEKTINGLKVKVNIPEGKSFCGFYTIDNKDGTYTIFGQCDKNTGMVTTDGYEIVDVFVEGSQANSENSSDVPLALNEANELLKDKYTDIYDYPNSDDTNG